MRSKRRGMTRLIVGAHDETFIQSNKEALSGLGCRKELRIIPGAGHLFEEPGKLNQVARISANWFGRYLTTARCVLP